MYHTDHYDRKSSYNVKVDSSRPEREIRVRGVRNGETVRERCIESGIHVSDPTPSSNYPYVYTSVRCKPAYDAGRWGDRAILEEKSPFRPSRGGDKIKGRRSAVGDDRAVVPRKPSGMANSER